MAVASRAASSALGSSVRRRTGAPAWTRAAGAGAGAGSGGGGSRQTAARLACRRRRRRVCIADGRASERAAAAAPPGVPSPAPASTEASTGGGAAAKARLPWHNPARWWGAGGGGGASGVRARAAPPLSAEQLESRCGPAAAAAEAAADPRSSGRDFAGVYPFSPRWEVGSATAHEGAPTVVLAPGFGNTSSDYAGAVRALERRGFKVIVASVARGDWVRVFAAGLPNRDFWRAAAEPEVAYGWYLRRLEAALANAHRVSGRGVALVGHSAGGWLARHVAEKSAPGVVSHLVSLGTPHFPTPAPGRDMTGGALTAVAAKPLPEATKVICVAGRAVRGLQKERLPEALAEAGIAVRPDQAAGEVAVPWEVAWRVRACESYKEVACEVEVSGDGVVPANFALLGEGAKHVVIDGCFHAMNTPTVWYGSNRVVDAWLPTLL